MLESELTDVRYAARQIQLAQRGSATTLLWADALVCAARALERVELELERYENNGPLVIEVEGGVVQTVLGLWPGMSYEIRDLDDEKERGVPCQAIATKN